MHRYFVTGTDTDVGKTRVTAAVAAALVHDGLTPAIVKFVQTGVARDEPGDAHRASALSGVAGHECARFALPADPWSAALAERREPVRAADLADAVAAFAGPIVVEGAGGALVPLNERESVADAAALAHLEAIVAVGLRLGCISHALLTIEALEARGIRVAGAVLCERWEPATEAYRADVLRALQGKCRVLGIVPFDTDERRSVAEAARLFRPLLQKEHS